MTKEFEPDDPMELVGVSVPDGDPDQVLDGIVQEYLMMGWSPRQILFLFRSPYYAVSHQVLTGKGEDYVEERVRRLADKWASGWIDGGEANA